MNTQLESAKKIFYASGLIVITGGMLSLLYYAYLMPLHVDEAGFWFNYTNRSYQYRFVFNPLNPNHTLTIYLAKISLWMFGNTGIGLRFPVIVFSVLSVGVFYLFVRKVTGSGITGVVGASLLFLNPFFLHYSHELRGYSAYFFFLVCCYLCFTRLLEKGNKLSTWAMLFILFIACYVANLAAPIFFSILLATIWIFVILRRIVPIGDRVPGFENIQIGSLFSYSIIAASFFAFIMFYVDRAVMPNLFAVQISESNYLAIPDLFSAFLGYHYLDDATSELYSYPTVIWLVSLSSFLYGLFSFMKNKSWQASFFLMMFVLNSLFYISLQTWVPLRSSVYLLPFILLFQAHGLKTLVEMAITRFFPLEYRDRYSYLTLAGILVFYFSFFSIGKYRNFEPDSGNPFELARSYLENNIGPNDLIISSLYGTVSAFYYGRLIRKHTSNIYTNNKLEGIYYLTSNPDEIQLPLWKVKEKINERRGIIELSNFKRVVSFGNSGVRPAQVSIFKIKFDSHPFFMVDVNAMSNFNYFGTDGRGCQKELFKDGIRLRCNSSRMACSNKILIPPDLPKNSFQLVIFDHLNDLGTETISFSAMNKVIQESSNTLISNHNIFLLNTHIDTMPDDDRFRKNVPVFSPTIQRETADGSITLLCMFGKIFEGNSLLRGIRGFSFSIP